MSLKEGNSEWALVIVSVECLRLTGEYSYGTDLL